MAPEVSKVNFFNPAMTGVQGVNPFVQTPAIQPAKAVGGEAEKYSKFDRQYEGNRPMLTNEYRGVLKGQENFATHLYNA